MSWLDLTEDKVDNTFDPLPKGTYPVRCESAEVKDSKSGGQYINVKFDVTDGEFMGRKIFTMFNIKNDNAKAVEIGRGQLKRFMQMSGMEDFKLTKVSDLEGLTVDVNVTIREDDYGKKNNITSYKEFTGTTVQTTTVTADDIPF